MLGMVPFTSFRVTRGGLLGPRFTNTPADSQYVTLTGDRQIELRSVATSRCQAVADTSSGGAGVEVQ